MPFSSHPLHAFQSLQITKCQHITKYLLHLHELIEKVLPMDTGKQFYTKNVRLIFLINIIISSSIFKPFFRNITPLHYEDRCILTIKVEVIVTTKLLYFQLSQSEYGSLLFSLSLWVVFNVINLFGLICTKLSRYVLNYNWIVYFNRR